MRFKRRTFVALTLSLFSIAVVLSTTEILPSELEAKEFSSDDTQSIEESATSSFRERYQEELESRQEENGSWDNEIDSTALATIALSDDLEEEMLESGEECGAPKPESYNESKISDSIEWLASNYIYAGNDSYDKGRGHALPEESISIEITVESASLTNLAIENYQSVSNSDEYEELQVVIAENLAFSQQQNGSWNDDVSDTALAIYSLQVIEYEDQTVIDKGIEWLIVKEKNNSWGSVRDSSLAIIALSEYGIDVGNEVRTLIDRQYRNGSFGSVEETAWAIITLSRSNAFKPSENALEWLNTQKPESDKELALVTFALKEHEYAQKEMSKEDRAPLIPKEIYGVLILIIGVALAVLGLFARIDESNTFDGVRKYVYEYIKENPGEHLSKIMRELSLSSSSAEYHLKVLELSGKIISHQDGKYKRYYINGNGYRAYLNGNGYKEFMSTLKNETTRKILKFLIEHPNSSQKTVAKLLNLHPSTVNWHANRLKKINAIKKSRVGKSISYSITQKDVVEKVLRIIER